MLMLASNEDNYSSLPIQTTLVQTSFWILVVLIVSHTRMKLKYLIIKSKKY